jgi:hypothetical protein
LLQPVPFDRLEAQSGGMALEIAEPLDGEFLAAD